MFKSGFWKFVAPSLVIAAAALAIPSVAMQGDTIADRVLGQFDFLHNAPNLIDAKGLSAPGAVAIDTSVTPNRLYVADFNNSRVLGYKSVTAFVNGKAADLVIGQPDFISGICDNGETSASSLCEPAGVAVDPSGNLYIGDQGNDRVLEYNTPFAGCGGTFPCVGGAANRVFGQGGDFTSAGCDSDTNANPTADDLCSLHGVTTDASGNLYVADQGNNRVVEYDNPLAPGPGTPGTPGSAGDTTADHVFGQGGSFTSQDCGLSASSLCFPEGAAVDASGNVYIADFDNNRVLEYNTPLTETATAGSGDTIADRVFGQGGSFTSNNFNNGGLSADSMGFPFGVALDSGGNLYVADGTNHRVLKYANPLAAGGGTPGTPGSAGDTTADVVFGQGGSFTSSASNNGGVSADSLFLPLGVAVDASGNLYIADQSNNRVLEYNTPVTTTADIVLGQLDFLHNAENLIDAKGFSAPESVAIDTSVTPNRLYVSDESNSRVLGYKDVTTFVNGGPADLVIGQPDFLSSACDNGGISSSSLCTSNGVAVDAGGNLYVADTGNARVLEYNTPFAGCGGTFPCVGHPANRVFGQRGDFTSNECNSDTFGNSTADDLCVPFGVATDAGRNLYVADQNNNRVLEYNNPLAPGPGTPGTPGSAGDTTADHVFGQGGNFASSDCDHGGVTANSLCFPVGVALDANSNLYVADQSNNRVLEYNAPLTVTATAGSGDTTADLVFGQGGAFTSS